MNPHSDNSQDDDRDEKRIASFLSAAEQGAPPPDRAFLDRLREESTAAFQAANTPSMGNMVRRHMYRSFVRWTLTAAALLLMVGGYLLFFGKSGPEFGTILDNVARADTIHLKIDRGGRESDIWAVRDGKLRLNEADGTYLIARDGRTWQIDEKARRKTPRTRAFFGTAGLDALALLDLLPEDRHVLAGLRPVGTVTKDGVKCYHYHATLTGVERALNIDALVDVANQHLVSLEVSRAMPVTSEPLARLTVLGWNQPVDEQQFVVKDGLSEDSRLGKLVDLQGVVAIKPVMHDRWTPVSRQVALKPGDWIETEPRGANAAALRLEKQGRLIVGPGSLVELVAPTQIRVHSGTLEVTAPDKEKIEVVGPFDQKIAIEGKLFVKVEKDKLVRVEREPLWLRGFKGATANESVGSLIANVDGRHVPLSVGYHKVSVEIRDQIARTVIEESFVNHTDGQLEGVFQFPLPQDASISGFGMWIGNELVEADIVEKQRAREIYETIRSENRDPGLLEWNGGNLFTARVWPIFPNSEKRIKITYTQVLPLRGNRFTYSYALQSDMLKAHPLRELAIDVKVNSALPLKSVECVTHMTRTDRTKHSAHVEFSAKEYRPERDFEVAVEVDAVQQPIVAIPHRRGDDGYFMLQILPPAQKDVSERALLGNGEPLNLVILADTSASMDRGQRAAQSAFLAALFTALTPKDTVHLACCDVNCDWVFSKPMPATSEHLRSAQEFLRRRASLGWTDLDRAFASAFEHCGPNTQLIYVGDGIPAMRDFDAAAFTKRLRQLYDRQGKGTVHAVAVGSTHEMSVLRTMASLGGGSVRRVGGSDTPAGIAHELLEEIAAPALRDLKVEFKGLRTARVYPEQLPNVPAGAQQIVLGRFLPDGAPQDGEVTVTGNLGGKPIRYTAPIVLKDAETGNSFIPRLWARMHLDQLLQQGATDTVRDDIIALSEEYNIITPYTSFLVLETDADRERFKVKRGFRMRDGERFFAQGRDNVNYDLVQKQMKKAGTWRIGMRQSVLQRLATLGRNPYRSQRRTRGIYKGTYGGMPVGSAAPVNMPVDAIFDVTKTASLGDDDAGIAGGQWGEKRAEQEYQLAADFEARGGVSDEKMLKDGGGVPLEESLAGEIVDERLSEFDKKEADASIRKLEFMERYDDGKLNLRSKVPGYFFANGKDMPAQGQSGQRVPHGWLENIFPTVPPAPRAVKEPKSTWPDGARELSRSLLRDLTQLKNGIRIVRRTDRFDRWNALDSRTNRTELISPKAWLITSDRDGMIQWCDGKERGIVQRAFQLGRLRKVAGEDLRRPPVDIGDYSLQALDALYRGYVPEVKKAEDGKTLLILRQKANTREETRFLIDTERHVVISVEHVEAGKVTQTTRFEDFVEVAGRWWARTIEVKNGDGQRIERITQTVEELNGDGWQEQWKRELAGRDEVQFLQQPLPDVPAAKRALAAGKTTFEDRIVLFVHFLNSQQWKRGEEHLRAANELAGPKPGLRWLRNAFWQLSRRRDELRQALNAEVERLTKLSDKEQASADTLALADHVIAQAASNLETNEMLAVLDRLLPIATHQPAERHVSLRWQRRRIDYLSNDAGLPLLKQLATDHPHDHGLQNLYAQRLANAGEYPAAYSWIVGVLDNKTAKWTEAEEEDLRGLYIQFLEQQGRLTELVDYATEWIKKNPTRETAYAQLLSALVRSDQEKKANVLIAEWLGEARPTGEISAAANARLNAAVRQALGQGHNLWTNRIDERWYKPLADTAVTCAKNRHLRQVAFQILNGNFSNQDECRLARKAVLAELLENFDRLSANDVYGLINEGLRSGTELDKEASDRLRERLYKRWEAEKDQDERNSLAWALKALLRSRGETAAIVQLEREQWKRAQGENRWTFAASLYGALVAEPWSAEIEDELFRLLDQSHASKDVAGRVGSLQTLVDHLISARVAAKAKGLEHPEKLTRIELRKKEAEFEREARLALVERLAKEAGKHGKELEPWLTVERLYLSIKLERDLKQAAAECWVFLGDKPKPAPELAEDEHNSAAVMLEAMLRLRYLVMAANLAARKDAEPALADRLLGYLAAGQAAEPENSFWQKFTYEVLVALDRAKDLEAKLQVWIKADDPDSRWRVALGFLLAEQGKIPEAIQLFEGVAASDELASVAYRSLADWYMVVDRRGDHEKAKIAAYKTMPEWQLQQMIQAKAYVVENRDRAPGELDKEVLLMLAALFEKSSQPQNHVWQVQRFYRATGDFRLLAGLADAVIGHSAGSVYPLLQNLHTIFQDIHDEATVDEIVAQIQKVRGRAKTPVDQRALDLLEMEVQWRASRLKNQPGPHAEAALAALKRALKRDWTPGEPRLMGDLLASLGQLDQAELAKVQLTALADLHRAEKVGTYDRLHLASRLATTLNAYGRRDEAIQALEPALAEFKKAHDRVLPNTANDAINQFVTLLEQTRQFDRAEKFLEENRKHPFPQQQYLWLTQRLHHLYLHALENNGTVSLGKGQGLYEALEKKLRDDLVTTDQNHRYALFELLVNVYRTGHEQKMNGADGDLRTFAFDKSPELLRTQTVNRESVINSISQAIHKVLGAREAVAFLVTMIEREPRWLRLNNQDGWCRQGWQLGHWRAEAKELGPDLEARLLRIVLDELRRDLESMQERSRHLYIGRYQYYWAAKEADFVKVAEEVLARRKQSGPAVLYIADYLFHDVNRPKRAIEILLAAHQQKLLEENGQVRLVSFLHLQGRYGESIALLKPLVEKQGDRLDYRVLLMTAYFRTKKDAELRALLKETDTLFHKDERWMEGNMATLAQSCLNCELYAESVAYYKELIPLHQRTHARRGIGNGVLSAYYTYLAQAYSGLHKTPEAVEAACGAIVSWGPRLNQRQEAFAMLARVLREARQLDAFAADLDQRGSDTGMDSAIVRKTLGRVYLEKGEFAKATRQLKRADELQPNDPEVQRDLLDCFDRQNDKPGAVEQLLEAVQASRRDLKLYQELGQRLQALGRAAEAERAFTSLVEMLPTESDGHALLAAVREQQNRWDDAFYHWEKVVTMRALEPTGLLGLAKAQIHEKQWEKASASIAKLKARSWPVRFTEVGKQINELEKQIPGGK
jgi:Flp pilus assembly protein TadD